MTLIELKDFLDEKADLYNNLSFIENDPVQIPHRYEIQQDVEIAGFLAATIAWGNRKSIIKSADKMMDYMGNSPYDFVLNCTDKDFEKLGAKAVHRTFSAEDFQCFMMALQNIYRENNSLESLFLLNNGETNLYHALERFRTRFFKNAPDHRSRKHVSSSYKNSACKRLIMYLRWMVRQDKKGVDFGIWKNIDPAYLSVPLDVHTANVSRKLDLVKRKQNDWKTVEEMDIQLRLMDPKDPARYDFALFGLGVSKDF